VKQKQSKEHDAITYGAQNCRHLLLSVNMREHSVACVPLKAMKRDEPDSPNECCPGLLATGARKAARASSRRQTRTPDAPKEVMMCDLENNVVGLAIRLLREESDVFGLVQSLMKQSATDQEGMMRRINNVLYIGAEAV
jgi:hypothetical protein